MNQLSCLCVQPLLWPSCLVCVLNPAHPRTPPLSVWLPWSRCLCTSGCLLLGLIPAHPEHCLCTGSLVLAAPSIGFWDHDHLTLLVRATPGQVWRCCRVPGLPDRHRGRRPGTRRGRPCHGPEAGGLMSASSPTLGLALLVALAGGAGAVLRWCCRPPPRPATIRPIAGRHPGGQRIRFPAPRRADLGFSLYHGLGPPRARRGRCRACAGGTPRGRRRAGRRSTCSHTGHPLPGGRLHAGRACRLPGRRGRRHRPHGVGLTALFRKRKASGRGQVHIRLRSP